MSARRAVAVVAMGFLAAVIALTITGMIDIPQCTPVWLP